MTFTWFTKDISVQPNKQSPWTCEFLKPQSEQSETWHETDVSGEGAGKWPCIWHQQLTASICTCVSVLPPMLKSKVSTWKHTCSWRTVLICREGCVLTSTRMNPPHFVFKVLAGFRTTFWRCLPVGRSHRRLSRAWQRFQQGQAADHGNCDPDAAFGPDSGAVKPGSKHCSAWLACANRDVEMPDLERSLKRPGKKKRKQEQVFFLCWTSPAY